MLRFCQRLLADEQADFVGEDGCVTSSARPGNATVELLAVRPPQQRRSREAWVRVLDAGVALLEEGGYEAFTIAAVCERARVAPRAIYDRTDRKDALFLAVYEHGMARVRADQDVFTDEDRWRDLPAPELAIQAVRETAAIFFRHAALLRAVVLISGAHPEVYRRGALYSRELGDLFGGVVLRARDEIDHPEPEAAVLAAFNSVFSALVVRVAYGPAFASPDANDESFLETLGTMVRRSSFAPEPTIRLLPGGRRNEVSHSATTIGPGCSSALTRDKRVGLRGVPPCVREGSQRLPSGALTRRRGASLEHVSALTRVQRVPTGLNCTTPTSGFSVSAGQ